MKTCETCGNTYDKVFEIQMHGEKHHFDSFECAIARLAPVCECCGTRILGHGLESKGQMFCCAHCAKQKGVKSLKDRAEAG